MDNIKKCQEHNSQVSGHCKTILYKHLTDDKYDTRNKINSKMDTNCIRTFFAIRTYS